MLITIPKFPISKIANSIQMPKSASLVEKALYDSLSLVKKWHQQSARCKL